MDFFTVDKTTYLASENVTGVEKYIWIERFNEPSEFKIIGDPLNLMSSLPIGSFVSKPDSEEVMIVENWFMDESKENVPKLEVTGRSVSAYIMENRVVTFGYPPIGEVPPYPTDLWSTEGIDNYSKYPMHYDMGSYPQSWFAVERLLREFLMYALYGDENIPGLNVWTYGFSGDGYYYDENRSNYRVTKKLPYLSEAVYEILKGADIGLKVCRPGLERLPIEQSIYDRYYNPEPDPGLPDFSEILFFLVYRGVERIQNPNAGVWEQVTFNINDGDINNARYSWSDRKEKNGYYSGNLVNTFRFYPQDISGWDLRMASVNVDDWAPDPNLITPPYATNIIDVLRSRAEDVIETESSEGILLEVTGSKFAGPKYKFDYRLGDIVSVFANYGVNEKMRIVEVATIQDGEDEITIPTMRPPYNLSYGGST